MTAMPIIYPEATGTLNPIENTNSAPKQLCRITSETKSLSPRKRTSEPTQTTNNNKEN